MGSINDIYPPLEWKVILKGKSKLVKDDYIYRMVIGYCYDEVSSSEISIFISKQNYENILSGNYSVIKNPYGMQKIIITDKDNNIIPLVKGQNNDNIQQKEYIKRLSNT